MAEENLTNKIFMIIYWHLDCTACPKNYSLFQKGGTVTRKMHVKLISIIFIFLTATIGHAGVIYSNNFDNENVSCWNNIKDEWRSSCGDFHDIGKGDRMQLSSKYSHSGSYSAVQKARYNEDRGQAYLRLASPMTFTNGYDELYVRMWNYYTGDDGKYDHGSMAKIMRVMGSDNSTAPWNVIVTVNDNDQNRDSESIAIRYNGGPNDWGATYGSYTIPDNKWVCFEFHVKLNTLGKSDGLVEFYIDGNLKARKTNINIRGNYNYKINSVLVGGWYSNSGKNSNQWNYRYIDDVAISTNYIGPGSSSSSSNNPPVIRNLRHRQA